MQEPTRVFLKAQHTHAHTQTLSFWCSNNDIHAIIIVIIIMKIMANNNENTISALTSKASRRQIVDDN